jgi:hypothetical protein
MQIYLLLIVITSLSAPFVLPALDIIQHVFYTHIHLNCAECDSFSNFILFFSDMFEMVCDV